MDLSSALEQFDRTETNLLRLESCWSQISDLIPDSIVFGDSSPSDLTYRDLCRSFDELVGQIPAINGWRIEGRPLGLNEIAQNRFDAQEIGGIEVVVSVEEGILQPAKDIVEYRFRFGRERGKLVRERASELIPEIDSVLAELLCTSEQTRDPLEGDNWTALTMTGSP